MEEHEIFVDVKSSSLSESSSQPESSSLSESIQRELDTLWANTNEAKNFTIFRTPHIISKSKKNHFKPTAISIGPFHRGKKQLRALEEQKKRFLQDFLSRGNNRTLDLCISEMKLLEMKTRKCYSETFDNLDSNAFVKMMLLDGCFLLEYFLRIYRNSSVVEVGWNSYFIQRDLLLLENQIPFYIVEKLYEIGNLNQEVVPKMIFVKYIAFVYLSRILPTKDYPIHSIQNINSLNSIIPDPAVEIHHLVHLCYHYLVPHPEKPNVLSSKSFYFTRMFSANRIKCLLHRFCSMVLKGTTPHSTSQSLSVASPNSTGNISSMVIHSAIELKQKGLKFTKQSNARHMLDISFEYGELKIPKLAITDDTKPFFANLLAFEHSKYGNENSPFGRFLSFLDKLVNTPKDVTILQECGILENWLGSEEELAQFLNQVTEGNFVKSNHYLVDLYKEVNRYTESSWHRHRAKLVRDYFSSPWSTISVIAAFILLVLTLVQSFFAIFSYFRPPKP